jgi:peptide/nickel transport system substrate-binding protein
MGLDRQRMLTNVFRDQTTLADGPFPAGAVISDSTIHALKYDTAAAKAALDAAGWRVGDKGVRARNGRPLALEILVPSSSLPRLRYAELIQEQLNKLGFQIELERATSAQFGPRFGAGDYDLTLLVVNTDPTVAGIQQFWSGAGLAAGSNFSRYQSALVDAKLDSASRAPTAAEMKRLAGAAYQRIIDDVPAVFLYTYATTAALNRRIDPAPFPLDGWWGNLAEWSIPADKRIDRDRIGLAPAAR